MFDYYEFLIEYLDVEIIIYGKRKKGRKKEECYEFGYKYLYLGLFLVLNYFIKIFYFYVYKG